MGSIRLIPPLRIMLTTQCNGECWFCHNEGNQISDINMPTNIIEECIQSVIDLNIPKVTLTGGEPTLRGDLHTIINELQNETEAEISLVTNGIGLSGLSERLQKPIGELNLSVSSFDNKIAKKYQNVDVQSVLMAFKGFQAINKNLNIVITKENYSELDSFIEWCINKKASLDIMFLKENDPEYIAIEAELLNKMLNEYEAAIVFRATSIIEIRLSRDSILHIKHPYLSGLFYNNVCSMCDDSNECFEKICAIRVHPTGIVTPCLSQKIVCGGNSVCERITNAYQKLEKMRLRNDFFYCG